ncbi:MAG: hypothetical protein ACK4J0_03395 [Candidatus Anstonellaceae archaeon]
MDIKILLLILGIIICAILVYLSKKEATSNDWKKISSDLKEKIEKNKRKIG